MAGAGATVPGAALGCALSQPRVAADVTRLAVDACPAAKAVVVKVVGACGRPAAKGFQPKAWAESMLAASKLTMGAAVKAVASGANSPNSALTAPSPKPWARAKAAKLEASGSGVAEVITANCSPSAVV